MSSPVAFLAEAQRMVCAVPLEHFVLLQPCMTHVGWVQRPVPAAAPVWHRRVEGGDGASRDGAA